MGRCAGGLVYTSAVKKKKSDHVKKKKKKSYSVGKLGYSDKLHTAHISPSVPFIAEITHWEWSTVGTLRSANVLS